MTRRRTKRMAAALAPVAASVVGLALGTQRAEAATVSRNEVFAVPGTSYSCFITITNQWPFDGHATLARGRTEVTGGTGSGAEACFMGRAAVGAEWLDPDNAFDAANVNSDGTFVVERLFAPVGSDLTTLHRVRFDACDCTVGYFLDGNPSSK